MLLLFYTVADGLLALRRAPIFATQIGVSAKASCKCDGVRWHFLLIRNGAVHFKTNTLRVPPHLRIMSTLIISSLRLRLHAITYKNSRYASDIVSSTFDLWQAGRCSYSRSVLITMCQHPPYTSIRESTNHETAHVQPVPSSHIRPISRVLTALQGRADSCHCSCNCVPRVKRRRAGDVRGARSKKCVLQSATAPVLL